MDISTLIGAASRVCNPANMPVVRQRMLAGLACAGVLAGFAVFQAASAVSAVKALPEPPATYMTFGKGDDGTPPPWPVEGSVSQKQH